MSPSNRHYGLELGDKVILSPGGLEGIVNAFVYMDNNSCEVKLKDGTLIKVPCEWCKVISQIEEVESIMKRMGYDV
jgi:preprotein translocase subunit YajC